MQDGRGADSPIIDRARNRVRFHRAAVPKVSYNIAGRQPLVAVKDGRVPELVRLETIADLLARDRI
jgi:hypothetical protein